MSNCVPTTVVGDLRSWLENRTSTAALCWSWSMQRVALADRHHVRTDKGATAGDEFAIDAPTQDCARLRLVFCAIGNDSYILYIKMTF